jgi:hypothetical protein
MITSGLRSFTSLKAELLTHPQPGEGCRTLLLLTQAEPQAHDNAAAKMLTRKRLYAARWGQENHHGQLAPRTRSAPIRKGGTGQPGRDHLPRSPVKKWKDELLETIPGCQVTIFDAQSKSQAVLLREMVELYTELKGSTKGRWKKPVGANWYVLGKNQTKFLPTRKPGAMSRKALLSVEDEDGKVTRKVIKQDRCPRCGSPTATPRAARSLHHGEQADRQVPVGLGQGDREWRRPHRGLGCHAAPLPDR